MIHEWTGGTILVELTLNFGLMNRVAQASREAGADNFDPATTAAGLLVKGGVDDPVPASAVPPESEFGGLVSYFSSQQEDFEES